MTKETKTVDLQEKAKEKRMIKLTLSNGLEVQFDPAEANGHSLMKSRQASGGFGTVIYMLAEIATFDGEKLPAPEILNFNAFDVIKLEEAWANSQLGK